MKRVAVIDYGMCNLDSVVRAIQECGGSPYLARQGSELKDASYLVLPGVGAFSDAMRNMQELGFVAAVQEEAVKNRIPLLGICLGMQLLASEGFEGGRAPGLNLIEGQVCKFKPESKETRIPHIGWNEVHIKKQAPIFDRISSNSDFYFVHSYHFICKNADDTLATTPYCGDFVSVVGRGNIAGVQFHPEKSLHMGLRLLANFLSM